MIRWWVGCVWFLASATIAVAGETLSVPLSAHLEARLTRDFEIVLVVTPHKGDAWTRLSRRVTGDATKWRTLAEHNKLPENLTTDHTVEVPFGMLRPEIQREVVTALFPEDEPSAAGWKHKVTVSRGGEGEPLWKIAEWFTGDGANYVQIRKANPSIPLATAAGMTIVVPDNLLQPPFRTARRVTTVAAKTARDRAPSTSEPQQVTTSDKVAATPRATTGRENAVSTDLAAAGTRGTAGDVPALEAPAELEFVTDGGAEYAVYRLKKGEALYSSVVSRFTGRVFAKDVNEVLEKIVAINGIGDVARIAVDHPIRIPVDLLTPEYLPAHNAARIAYERKRDSAKAASRRVSAKNLNGIHIILDAGHGGRDVGTVHESVWESSYVYDVMCRVKELLEKNSGAKVHVTTRSADRGFRVSDRDVLENRTDHVVLTKPEYVLDDPVVGVNLRWYLANSVFRRAVSNAVPPEKVIFISIHADSLHPSLRGAMAYIPGGRFVQGSFSKSGSVYLAREEVRESPSVEQTEEEALRAEGLSRELAEAIITAMSESDLPVHPFNPVRENVIRDGKEWVPAIIRYNKVPARLLLEVCNLGNEEDRSLIQTRRYRQQLARAIYRGIVEFYESKGAKEPERKQEKPTLAAAAK